MFMFIVSTELFVCNYIQNQYLIPGQLLIFSIVMYNCSKLEDKISSISCLTLTVTGLMIDYKTSLHHRLLDM